MTPKTSRFDGACGHRAPGPTGRRPRGTHAPPPRLGRRLPLRTWPRQLHTATCAPFLASSPPLHLRLPCGNSAQSSSATSRIGLPAGRRAPGGPPWPPLFCRPHAGGGRWCGARPGPASLLRVCALPRGSDALGPGAVRAVTALHPLCAHPASRPSTTILSLCPQVTASRRGCAAAVIRLSGLVACSRLCGFK